MGDDPYIPVGAIRGTSNNSAINYFVNNVGKTGIIVMVTAIGLSLGLSIGAIVMMAWGQSMHREQVAQLVSSAEKRTMDHVYIAEREARIAMDEVERLKISLKVNPDH
jgi:hypothetical protein